MVSSRPGASLNLEEKLAIAQQLARLGVDVIEAGFPFASPGDFAAVQRIAQQVGGEERSRDLRIGPCIRADIKACADAVAPAPRGGAFTRSSPPATSTSSTSCARAASEVLGHRSRHGEPTPAPWWMTSSSPVKTQAAAIRSFCTR